MAPAFEDAVHSLKGARHVVDVRNQGLVAGIELQGRAGAPNARGYETFVKCFERGVLVRQTGDIIALAPALIVEQGHIERMVGTLREVLETVE